MSPRPSQGGSDEAFLKDYRPDAFPRPAVAVDLVVFTAREGELDVLLVRRGQPPFRGAWALPGGFLRARGDGHRGEGLDDAAARELEEETGLRREDVPLVQFASFGDPKRDPRMHVVSVAYLALVRSELAARVRPAGGGDADAARFVRVSSVPLLAFDHTAILGRARESLVREIDRGIAFALVPATFTIAELRTVHEAIGGAALDPGNFRRRFQRWLEDGLIERADGVRKTASKPAALYRRTT